MKWVRELRQRFDAFRRRRQMNAEMTEEMRHHLELQARENVDAGMSPEEARYAALRQFGHVEGIKETCRDQRGLRWLEEALQDVRFGFRQLRKNPGFTAIALLILGLGVGVNTSMFTALQAVMVRPLPYPDSDRLVQLFSTSPGSARGSHSVPNFLDCEAQAGVFEHMGALTWKPFNLAEPGQPAERINGLQVSSGFFPALGIQPALGRLFSADEDRPGQNQVVLLDHYFWLRRFAGDTNIVGRTLRLDGEAVTVVGVMPARAHDSLFAPGTALWRPIGFTDDQRRQRGHHFLKAIARLKPGVTITEAQAEVDTLAARLARDYPDENTAQGLRLVPLARSFLPAEGRVILWSLMALAGFVLLIACANLANLQFGRMTSRVRELATRAALGAPRGRLARQLLTECLLLATLGGALGVVLAAWGNAVLSRQLVFEGEQLLSLSLDVRALVFALAASTAAGLAFGLIPAWLASRADVNEAMKQGARGTPGDRSHHRWQRSLVVTEMALAMVLLAGAGLVVNGLRGLSAADPGWRLEGLTVGQLNLPDAKYGNDDALRAFADRLAARLAAVPGAERVSLCRTLPLRQFNVTTSFAIDGRAEPPKGHAPNRFVNGVNPGYFETLGMRLLAGRDFTAADGADHPPVVIINEAMARAWWPGQSPLGQRLGEEEIVGVVNDVRFPANPEKPRTPYQTYRPLAQAPSGWLSIAVRGSVPAEVLRRTVAELDPDQPVGEAGQARARVEQSIDNWALGGRLLTAFAALGLALAGLGIYGVTSGFVARRTGEIGLRMALGARLQDVQWLVLGTGVRLGLLGAAIGLLGAIGIARLVASVLPELPANDPLIIALATATLMVVALFACWLPARRAAKVDPVVALRAE